MSQVAVRVEHLSKRYRLGQGRPAYGTLRDTLVAAVQTPLRALSRASRRDDPPELWALRDVSFEVRQGEVLGIIGRNGAGKSTLLKILARVTRPTGGRATLHGRVGSLLEVGTGFHPELTGRENIYLNGAVLGMRKSEIQRKFDAIVAFAELDPFLDTPVKRYSSGMYMRLAFAVAAHLEPEILVVDEVLAVGDAAFQQKCLGKMQAIAGSDGRTILFVSHNLNAVQRLCSRCILVEHGQLVADGVSANVVARYLAGHLPAPTPNEWLDVSHLARVGTGEARLVAVQYSSLNHAVDGRPYPGGPLEIHLAIDADRARVVGSLAVSLSDASGTRLINADTVLKDQVVALQRGRNVVRLRIEALHLNPGVYRLGLWLADPISAQMANTPYDYLEAVADIEVIQLAAGGNGLSPNAAVTCDFGLLGVS